MMTVHRHVLLVCGVGDTNGRDFPQQLSPASIKCSGLSCSLLLPPQPCSWCRTAVVCRAHQQLCLAVPNSGASACSVALQQQSVHISCGWSHLLEAADVQESNSSIIWQPLMSTAGPSTPFILPVRVQSVAAGQYHGLILDAHGGVWAIGSEAASGQLGLGEHQTAASTPQPVMGPALKLRTGQPEEGEQAEPAARLRLGNVTVTQVCTGHRHSCAITSCGALYTWGWGGLGALGHDRQADEWVPKEVSALGGLVMTQASAGAAHTLVLSDCGDVYGSGWNHHGELGLGHTHGCMTPTLMDSITESITQVSAGAHHSVLLGQDGQLWACGANDWGQCGVPSKDHETVCTPVLMPLPEQLTAQQQQHKAKPCSVQAGWWHTLVLVQLEPV